MAIPAYFTTSERVGYWALRIFVGLVLLFLIAPILAIMPLSFSSDTYFSYPLPGLSLKWYYDFFTNERWQSALQLSILLACCTTVLATLLGTLAALGITRGNLPFRATLMAILISPMIVPVIISALGMFFFYSSVGLTGTIPGLILAHTALATPFVVITVIFIAGPTQRTLPRQMFSGIREQISPTITAAASVLIVFSTILLVTVELLRRRGERLRGVKS